jgi:hypothetical protein
MFMNAQQMQHENKMLDMCAVCQNSGKASRGTVCTWLKPGRTRSAAALSMIIAIDFPGRLYLHIVDSSAGLVGRYAAFIAALPVITHAHL